MEPPIALRAPSEAPKPHEFVESRGNFLLGKGLYMPPPSKCLILVHGVFNILLHIVPISSLIILTSIWGFSARVVQLWDSYFCRAPGTPHITRLSVKERKTVE